MKHVLEYHHKEHLRKLGIADPPEHLEIHDDEYDEHYQAWKRTHPAADFEFLHMKALGHIASKRHFSPRVKPESSDQRRELRLLIGILAVIALLLLFGQKAHAQFSYPIATSNAGSPIGFHKSYFTINCGANMTCTDNGSTFNLQAGAGATVAWDGILAASGNFALAHAARTTTFTWGAATGAGVDMFTFADTLNNSGTGYILRVNLASGSAAKPFSAAVNGNGVSVSNLGVLAKLGTGSVNADQCNGAACGTVTSIATSAPITGGAITGTGTIACATCATTTNGGALSGTSPVTVSAAGAIGCATCLTANQSITLSGDVTGSGATAITTTNVNLPDGVTQAGSLLITDIAAPTSPAAAHLKVFGDSTDLRFHDKNAAGTIGTTAVSDTGATNNFFTGMGANGVFTKAQPAFSNLSGSATTGQLPGSGATTVSGQTCTLGSTCTVTRECSDGLGDGLNAITAGTYIVTNCFNDFGATYTITAVRCFTDNNGSSTLNAANDGATGLLTGAVTCTNAFASGTQGATTTIATSHWINFTFVADGTTKRATFEVTVTR